MKLKRNAGTDGMAEMNPQSYVFLTGDTEFFDNQLNPFAHAEMMFREPTNAMGTFYHDDITIDAVRNLWIETYNERARAAGVRPMAFWYFEKNKTARQAFKAWYYAGCQGMTDRNERTKRLNSKK